MTIDIAPRHGAHGQWPRNFQDGALFFVRGCAHHMTQDNVLGTDQVVSDGDLSGEATSSFGSGTASGADVSGDGFVWQAFSAGGTPVLNVCSLSPMTSLSQPLQAVVTLFEGPLAGVRFGEVDAAGLSKLAKEVSQVATQLAEHEAKLAALRQELEQRHEALLTLAQRALAYARIYAEGDQALSAQLSAISLPRAAKARKAGKSARPDEAEPAAVAVDESSARAEEVVTDEAAEPAKTKPSYARPKIKRKLARAATQSDSA